MNVQSGYDRWAATYDSDHNHTRDLDSQVTRNLLNGVTCESMLEIGCGTGKNTVWLADRTQNLVAFDFSAGMMAKARAKVQAAHVYFSRVDLTNPWPIRNTTFDWIVCNLVLEHIENLDYIFAQAHQVLVSGGRFFICELHPFKQYQGKQAIIQQNEQITPIPAFQHHISDFWSAAANQGFVLVDFNEWWHQSDHGKPPRLVSFILEKMR